MVELFALVLHCHVSVRFSALQIDFPDRPSPDLQLGQNLFLNSFRSCSVSISRSCL